MITSRPRDVINNTPWQVFALAFLCAIAFYGRTNVTTLPGHSNDFGHLYLATQMVGTEDSIYDMRAMVGRMDKAGVSHINR